MDKSNTAAAVASKKKPALSSRLVERTGVSRGSSSHRSTAAIHWSSRSRPPERLDWPTLTGGSSSVAGSSVTTNNAVAPIQQGQFTSSQESWPPSANNSSKRQRRPVSNSFHHHLSTQTSTFSQQQQQQYTSSPPPHSSLGGNGGGGGVVNSSSSSSSNALWTIKYAPRQPSDLVVAPKKVEQVASWIQSTLDGTSRQRLLVLVGSPGIGKSSMIHCLAAASSGGFHVLEWTESFMTRTNHETTWHQQQYQNGGFMAVEQPSPLYSFEAFLQQAAVGYSPLTLQTSSSSQQHPALSQPQHKQPKRPFSFLSQPQRRMAPSNNNNSNSNNNTSGLPKSVILLDELPHCHDDEAQRKFRHLLTNHIEHSVLPVILIFSNVLEGKHKPEDLEQLIEARVLYAPQLTTILQIHAATKVRLKKCLQHICQQEGIPTTSNSSKQKLQYDLYQDLHFRSGGDVRFAITTLQYEYACHHNPLNNSDNHNKHGASATKKKKSNAAKTTTCAITNESSSSERDQKLSMFHALGKLLYAKREPQNSSLVSSIRHHPTASSGDARDHLPPLTFDPEGVVEHCGIEVAGALSFLGYHSLDFYTDVEELSQAWDLFSDATYWLDRPTMDGGWYRSLSSSTASSAFPVGYASSLAGRAVACTNLHPAPHKFRQFSAPPVFEVLRKRRDNTSQIRHFQSRFDMLTMITTTSDSYNHSHAVSGLSHCHPNEFATDLAYVRMILPPEVVTASQLQSHFNSLPALQRRQQEEQETAAALLQEQEEVLRDDDIMDFDEDDSNNTNNHQINEGFATNKLTTGRPGGVAMSSGTENNKPSPTSSIENIPVSSAMVKVRFK
jgi:DNA polymerase III delta prime subunit